MSTARDEILSRIRAALRDVPSGEAPDDVPVVRDYRRSDGRGAGELSQLLRERLSDYAAEVERVAAPDVGRAVTRACVRRGLSRIVVPPGLPAQWRPDAGRGVAGIEVLEDHGITAEDLDAIDGAVTGCAAAIAETGTLVLDGQGTSGRRMITLIPDHHICVVTADQIFGQVPEMVTALAPAVRDRGAPVTLISGPSASSDIELTRVEGVHGPRNLLVLIVG